MRFVRGMLSFLLAVILLGSLLTAGLVLTARYMLTPRALADSLAAEGVLGQVQNAMVASAPALLDEAGGGAVPSDVRIALTPAVQGLVRRLFDPVWLRGTMVTLGDGLEKALLSDTPPADIAVDTRGIRNRLLQSWSAQGGAALSPEAADLKHAVGGVLQQFPAQVRPFTAADAAGVGLARRQYRLAAYAAPLVAVLAAVLLVLTAEAAAWRWTGGTLIVMALVLAAALAAAAVMLPVEMNAALTSPGSSRGLLGIFLGAMHRQQLAATLAGAVQVFLLKAWPVPAGALAAGLVSWWVGGLQARRAGTAAKA